MNSVLREDISVEEILESESNQDECNDKFNRVDVLVKDHNGRRIIIEIQNQREADYLERLLFGVSKVVLKTKRWEKLIGISVK